MSRLAPHQLQVAIIGAGATGVELAAELHNTTRQLVAFGLDRIDPEEDIKLNVIEAADRILPGLPERLSEAAEQLLKGLGVRVRTSSRVAAVTDGGVRLESGRDHPGGTGGLGGGCEGARFPEGPRRIGDQPHQSAGRPRHPADHPGRRHLRPRRLRGLPVAGKGGNVPPRAQAAHQQATHIFKQIQRRLAGEPAKPWRYQDFGSLVSLGEYSTVGNLMGGLIGGSLTIQGYFARMMYLSLYKMHEYCAPRLLQSRPRHPGPDDYPPHRAARQATLGKARRSLGRRRSPRCGDRYASFQVAWTAPNASTRFSSFCATARSCPSGTFLDSLEVSRATVKRDLEYLRNRMNAPIEWDRESGGYRLAPPEVGGRAV